MSELASSTNQMACLQGTSKGVPHSSGLSLIDVKGKLMWPPARHTSFKRGGCGASLLPHAILDLCQHPHSLSWCS